jgi:PAS domain S-box-containing protein
MWAVSQRAEMQRARIRWFALGVGAATGIFLLDIATSSMFVLISMLAAPPFIAAVGATRGQTLVVAVYSILLALTAGAIDEIFGTLEYLLKIALVMVVGLFAVRVATVRTRVELSSALDYAVANVLAETTTLTEATPKLLEAIGSLLGWEAGDIWETSPDRGTVRCLATWQIPSEHAEDFERLSSELEFAVGVGLPGRVWGSGEPTWVADVSVDPNFPRAKAARAAGLRGAIAFPIAGSRGVAGVVEFFKREEASPDDELLKSLTRLGRQIGQHLERRRAEDAVRQSEALRGAVLESALDCVITMNHEGEVVEFNPAAEEVFGYRRADAVGKPLADLIIPPRLRESHRAGLARYVRTGVGTVLGRRLELTGARADGTEFPVEVSIARIGVQDPPMFAGYLRDLTESKEAEASLERLAAIVEHSTDALIAVTTSGEIVAWNPAAERLYGYTAEEAIGRSFVMTVPPDRQEEGAALLRRVESGERVKDFETVRMRKDGSLLEVAITLSPLKGLDGSWIGAAGLVRDITIQKQTERERQRLLENERAARRRAEELERRATFIADAVPVLDSSLEFEVVVRNLVRLVVPNIADWCAIHTPGPDRSIELIAIGHPDPAKEKLAREFDGRHPIKFDQREGVPKVLRTGEPLLLPNMDETLLAEGTEDDERLEFARGLGLKSVMVVPLRARGQTFGTITFISAESGRRFGEDDLQMAVELAKRASLSIDNARLHGDLELQRQELQFLATASAELDRSLDLEKTLQSVADLTVPYLADGCMVDLLDESGMISRVASAAADPSVKPILTRLQSHELELEGPHPIAVAIRTGRLQAVAEITDELLREWSTDESYLEDVRAWPGRAVVVAPLRARGRMLGAISLASFGDRRFSPRSIATIEELARRAGVAADNARLYGERSYIASRLQQSLLPPHLPDVPGLEIAARFRPAGEAYEVGGDFYDIFETGKGSWAVAIGDVCGKGADAAALTSLARYSLRATAIRAEQTPEHVLQVLNEVLLAEAPSQQFLTVTLANLRIGDTSTEVTVASAGHPLPLLLRADGSVDLVGEPGTLLGIVPDPEIWPTKLELSAGDTLVLYTDGVTEARTRRGMFGTDGLRSAIAACPGCDAAEVAERIERSLLETQVDRPRDDMAIVIVQIPGNGSQHARAEPALVTRRV